MELAAAPRRRGLILPLAWIGGYALLGVTWAFTNPPGDAPDEESHYVRAVAVGRGDWLGQSLPPGYRYPNAGPNPDPDYLRLLANDSRAVTVPDALMPDPGWGCNLQRPDMPADCLGQARFPSFRVGPDRAYAYQASFPPFAYLPAGLAMRLAGDPLTALILGRLAMLAVSLALLAGAAATLWDGAGTHSLTGLVLVLTPMVVFLDASLGTSGLEVSASIAVLAALLSLARAPSGRAWTVLGIAGMTLAVARTTGIVWLALDGLVLLGLLGPAGALSVLRRPSAARWPALAAIAVGIAAGGLWTALRQPASSVFPEGAGHLLVAAARLPNVVAESIGMFGEADFELPKLVYLLWGGLGVATVAVAVLRGSPRQRRTLELAFPVFFLLLVGMEAFLFAPLGYDIRGRHLMPFGAVIPLLAGEIAHLHRDRLGRRRWSIGFLVLALVTGGIQLLAFLVNARRNAVGLSGPLLFFLDPAWSPGGGWLPWIVLATAGTVLLLAALLLGAGQADEGAGRASGQVARAMPQR